MMRDKDKTKDQLAKELKALRQRVATLEASEKEREQTEAALRTSQERLYQAQKMEALGTLVAGVAHEINNPINLIMFNIPLVHKCWNDFLPILKEDAAREPCKKYGGLTYGFLDKNFGQLLQDMDMAAKRVAKIVKDLKDFARQSNVTDKNPIHINSAVENAVRLSQTTLTNSGVHLELNLAPDLPLMEGNLQSIEQIVLNLIINAVQAIDHDHGRITIATGHQKNDGRIYVSIEDNGRGISPSVSDTLFDPFVTDKKAEAGTGLGLSVTYSLVKAHEGEITFQTQEGKGTAFIVIFPTSLKGKTAKILVVDDDELTRDMLTHALTTKRPYLVEEAVNGVEACIKLGTYHPQLLILDLLMPEMDGLEVCRAIQREPRLSDMKVLITTGFPDDPKLKEMAELGYTNLHFKPFTLVEFLKHVDEILAPKQAQM